MVQIFQGWSGLLFPPHLLRSWFHFMTCQETNVVGTLSEGTLPATLNVLRGKLHP
ncbi:hypothetical protein JXQ70_06670 [bacterium]|nr:hypothetical protein [bacterium]